MTPCEAKAASSEFLLPERQGNGLDSFYLADAPRASRSVDANAYAGAERALASLGARIQIAGLHRGSQDVH
jgi:hypothetical protein